MRYLQGHLSRLCLVVIVLGFGIFPRLTWGDTAHPAAEERAPDRYGMSLEAANVYDPGHDIGFALVTGFALYDYGKVWHQDRPKELCFKVEGAIGSTFRPNVRTVASVGMLALYYLDKIVTPGRFRPYFEAGIGAIYTDFRVEGQGLRFNFNPQFGIGTELLEKKNPIGFVALRLHHLSNGSLYHENRGMNSLLLQVGRYF